MVLFGGIKVLLMNEFFIFFIKDAFFDGLGNEISSFSFNVVNMGECFFEFGLFVVGYSLLGGLEVLAKDLDVDVLDLFVCEILDFLLHYSDDSLFFDADDIFDDDLFGS